MTPQSQSSDWNDPCLTVGKSYQDPASGVTITTQAMGSAVAVLGNNSDPDAGRNEFNSSKVVFS
jgi:hypothetical protein